MARKSPTKVATGLVDSVASFWARCAKQASKATRRLRNNSRISPKSPTAAAAAPQKPAKNLLATLSNKAIKLRPKNKKGGEDEVGDEGVWQREIMMGDKCQPLDFSGVIYYDKEGKRMSEVPTRSPRASPLHQYAYQSGKSDW